MKKRVVQLFSLLLVLCMLFCMPGLQAFAADDNGKEIPFAEYTEPEVDYSSLYKDDTVEAFKARSGNEQYAYALENKCGSIPAYQLDAAKKGCVEAMLGMCGSCYGKYNAASQDPDPDAAAAELALGGMWYWSSKAIAAGDPTGEALYWAGYSYYLLGSDYYEMAIAYMEQALDAGYAYSAIHLLVEIYAALDQLELSSSLAKKYARARFPERVPIYDSDLDERLPDSTVKKYAGLWDNGKGDTLHLYSNGLAIVAYGGEKGYFEFGKWTEIAGNLSLRTSIYCDFLRDHVPSDLTGEEESASRGGFTFCLRNGGLRLTYCEIQLADGTVKDLTGQIGGNLSGSFQRLSPAKDDGISGYYDTYFQVPGASQILRIENRNGSYSTAFYDNLYRWNHILDGHKIRKPTKDPRLTFTSPDSDMVFYYDRGYYLLKTTEYRGEPDAWRQMDSSDAPLRFIRMASYW